MPDVFIVCDVGGTQIRAALFAGDTTIPLKINRIPTQEDGTPPLERLLDLIASLWPENERVTAIAVAAPGPTDPCEGVVYEASNIPGWKNLPLKKIIQERFNVPCALGNDANLAALGEWRYGAGIGYDHLLYMTISTGIGGGIISDGRLLLGAHGLAGEIGHVTVMADGPMCSCGKRGHLEALASGPAITRWVNEQLSQDVPSILSSSGCITAREIAQAASNNDSLAVAALERAGTYLGIALANYLHIFNPSAIILGGGVAHSGPHLLDPLMCSLREHVLSAQYLQDLVLTTASLDDDGGLLGALVLAQSIVEN